MSDLTDLLEAGQVKWVVIDHDDHYQIHFMREVYTADEVRQLLEELSRHMNGSDGHE
jgi:hypothetical protein